MVNSTFWMPRLGTILLFQLAVLTTLASSNRVLLRDVTSITLHRGQQTTGRRSSSVPQLQCIGGTAEGKFSPKIVQCYNRGFDGLDVQWECTAALPTAYQFGRISVTCEGYEHPNDPYVLAGSCGLKYELDYSQAGAKQTLFPSDTNYLSKYMNIIYFVGIAFVLYLLYLSMTSTREGYEGDRNRGSYYPGDGPDGRRPPHPPGWRPQPPPPPSYDDMFGKSGTSQPAGGGGSSNFGFLSGLGLGGLGGYLLGNSWGRNNDWGTPYRRRGPTQFERDTGFYSDSYDQPGPSHYFGGSGSRSSSTHTSSGFGGTERR